VTWRPPRAIRAGTRGHNAPRALCPRGDGALYATFAGAPEVGGTQTRRFNTLPVSFAPSSRADHVRRSADQKPADKDMLVADGRLGPAEPLKSPRRSTLMRGRHAATPHARRSRSYLMPGGTRRSGGRTRIGCLAAPETSSAHWRSPSCHPTVARAAQALSCARWRIMHVPSDTESFSRPFAQPRNTSNPSPRSVSTLADWTQWTGLTFEASGQHAVPGALVPVHISVEQDHGVYVEPNVWLRHSLGPLHRDF
jgi:hypothetical protein